MPRAKAKNKVILGLPGFIESFGKRFGRTCFLCKSTFTTDSASTPFLKLKLLQKFYFRCLKPEKHVNAENLISQFAFDDCIPKDEGSLVFCEGCFDKIETLLELYQKLVELELKFNRMRTELVDVAINSYVNQTSLPAEKEDVQKEHEENAKQYWRKSIGLVGVQCFPEGEKRELCKSEENCNFKNNEGNGSSSASAMECMQETTFEGIDISIIKEEFIEEEDECFYQNEDLDLKDIIPEIPDPQKDKDKIEDNLLNPVVRLEKLELTDAQKIQLESLMTHSTAEGFGDDMEKDYNDTDFKPDFEDLEEEYCPPAKLKKVGHWKVVTRRQTRNTSNNDGEKRKPKIKVRKRKYKKKSKLASTETPDSTSGSTNGVQEQEVSRRKLRNIDCKGFKIIYRQGSDPSRKNRNGRKMRTRVQCDFCEQILNLRYIRTHIKTVHATGEKPYQCPHCPRILYEQSKFDSHLLTHSKDRYQCDQCEKTFSEKNFLRSHQARIHGIFEGENVSECKICQKKFFQPGLLKTHMKLKHDDGPKNNECYICEVCGKGFGMMQKLKDHMRMHGEKKHQCSYCGKRFRVKTNLNTHLAVHTGQKKLIKCTFCEERFPSKRLYRKHNAEKHTEEYLDGKLFVCKQVCYMNFGSENELAEHMVSKHKSLKCQECNRYFQRKHYFTKHMLTHTGERPFKCQICEKSFSQKANLQQHVFRHTGERPFRCETCDVGFLMNKEYRMHMESVHGEIIKATVASAIRRNKNKQHNAMERPERDNNSQSPSSTSTQVQ